MICLVSTGKFSRRAKEAGSPAVLRCGSKMLLLCIRRHRSCGRGSERSGTASRITSNLLRMLRPCMKNRARVCCCCTTTVGGSNADSNLVHRVDDRASSRLESAERRRWKKQKAEWCTCHVEGDLIKLYSRSQARIATSVRWVVSCLVTSAGKTGLRYAPIDTQGRNFFAFPYMDRTACAMYLDVSVYKLLIDTYCASRCS
jgi:hypothetical protein